MLALYDRDLTRRAVLQNAYDRQEETLLNAVGTYAFALPGDDEKAAQCAPMHFIRDGEGDFYRLLADSAVQDATGVYRFEAEHAIATLVDDIMFGTHLLGGEGMTTREVIEAILAHQTVPRWQLGDCDFDKQFEYGFSSENLLNALFAVPNLFVEPYQWTCDMRTTPWTVSLKRLDVDAAPSFYIRAGRNLIASRQARTGADLCTRLFLLGYGEGDNQLTIADINGGLPYLQSPQAVIDRYGLISKVYVDRSFEDAQSLMERGRALLAALETPGYTRTFDVADLYPLTGRAIDRARVGDVASLDADGSRAYVTGVKRNLDVDGDMALTLSTRAGDIVADLADLADRQRIEQVYAQGATQIYAQSVQANATPTTPAQLNFFIPREMRIINKVVAKISLDRFRSYSQATAGGGASTQTSTDGGGGSVTSEAGGGSTATTSSDGSTSVSAAQTLTLDSGNGYNTDASSVTVTESAHPSYSQITGSADGSTGSASATATGSAGGTTGSASGATGNATTPNTGWTDGTGTHRHAMEHTHSLNSHTHSAPSHTHSMLHTHSLGSHTHGIGSHRHHMSHTHSMWHQHTVPAHSHSIDAHTHRVTIPSHSHSVGLSAHSHSVSVPAHTHAITQGIFRFGSPKGAKILVGGVEKLSMDMEREIDLTEHLVSASGRIPRGSWIRLGVLPDDLAYITIDIVIQGFVQSRGGGTY